MSDSGTDSSSNGSDYSEVLSPRTPLHNGGAGPLPYEQYPRGFVDHLLLEMEAKDECIRLQDDYINHLERVVARMTTTMDNLHRNAIDTLWEARIPGFTQRQPQYQGVPGPVPPADQIRRDEAGPSRPPVRDMGESSRRGPRSPGSPPPGFSDMEL